MERGSKRGVNNMQKGKRIGRRRRKKKGDGRERPRERQKASKREPGRKTPPQ